MRRVTASNHLAATLSVDNLTSSEQVRRGERERKGVKGDAVRAFAFYLR
jgi:hypothetical protein